MRLNRRRPFIIFACVGLLIVILLGISVVRAYGSTNKICAGITAGGVSIGNLTTEEAAEKLRNQLANTAFDKPIYIVLGDVEKKIVPADFLASFEYEKTAKAALQYGKKGNFFSRIGQTLLTVFSKRDIPMEVSVDDLAYEEALNFIMDGVTEKVQEHKWEISDNKLIVTTGHPGLLPDKMAVSEAVLNTIRKGTYDKKIVFGYEERKPSALSAEYLYDKVASEAKDAYYALEDGKVVIYEHSLGVAFDKSVAQKEIDTHKGNGVTFEIPLTISSPRVTTEDVESQLFGDTLGEHETKFNTGDVGRSKNIALAAHKINGTILAPGEVFSYNGVVGERSYSEGFETAHVYVNGETVDGVGGGICQVSSTLFNAVVYANLEIVERVNHQLTVSYVPLGRDATVDYGNIDFRFKNTTGHPLKIVCTAENGVMYTGLFGKKEDKSLEVSFETTVIRELDPPERKKDDPTLPKGEEKVEKPGSSGYVVDTYKIVKRDGKETERTYLCRSTYNGTFREILVGTGEEVPEVIPGEENPEEGGETPSPTESSVPTESPSTSTPKPTPSEEPSETNEPDDDTSDTGL
ncbi:MAG: VanW family protein [Clostridia bacterium]|nr:VanW family protein [Clostridia bacterium]